MKKPNIFNYATSELSQDAVLMWLANWANLEFSSTDNSLHKTGKYFLNSLIQKAEYNIEDFDEVKVYPQFHKIDVFIELKNKDKKIAIIIEDKVKSSEHSNQLEKYYNKVKAEGYKKEQIIPIYLKTGFQHDLENVLKKGYYFFSVKDLIDVFEFGRTLEVKNEIFADYYEYLKKVGEEYEKDKVNFENYTDNKIKDWNWWNWIGFFNKNAKILNAEWGIVSNRRENLVAFWFGGVEKKVIDNDTEFIFHPYIDVKYSDDNYFTISYRLGLNGNPQKNKRLRDIVIQDMIVKIQDAGIEVKIPRFKKANETIELLKIINVNNEMDEAAIIKFLRKMENLI